MVRENAHPERVGAAPSCVGQKGQICRDTFLPIVTSLLSVGFEVPCWQRGL